MRKSNYLVFIVLVLVLTIKVHSQKSDVQMIQSYNNKEYLLVKSKEKNTFFLKENDANNESEILYVLPFGKPHILHDKNLLNIYIENDTVIFHPLDFTLSVQNPGMKNWKGGVYKINIKHLQIHDGSKKKYNENYQDYKESLSTFLSGRALESPLLKRLNFDEFERWSFSRDIDSVYYTFARKENESIIVENRNSVISIFRVGENWDKVMSHKTEGQFSEPKEYMDYFFTAGWTLEQKIPFSPGPIRTFLQNGQQYIVAVNTDEVFLIKENSLEKVAELPSGLAKDGTLIIDQDADEVFFAPQLKNAAYGQWREQAVNVLKDCPVEK